MYYNFHTQVFSEIDQEVLEDEARFYSLMFLVIGVIAGLGMFTLVRL